MKVYLSGAIAGVPDYKKIFARYADKVRQMGWTVYNPAANNLDDLPLRIILAIELDWLCREADAIALIPGFENSKGVAAELATANAIGLEVIRL